MVSTRILAALSLLGLIGCSAKAPATATAGNSATNSTTAEGSASLPLIHYDQTAVLTIEGEPREEQSYHAAVVDCQKAGYPMRTLTPDDAAKIGRVHVEAWISPDKQSRHEEEWHLNSPGPCQFSLNHLDHTEIDEGNGRVTTIDGPLHQVDVQELGKPAPVMPLPADDGELTEGARQAGWSKQGVVNDNGAQCAVWRSSTGFELCVWTGGGQWGYSADGSTALKEGVSRSDSIVFWAHPGRGVSWKLETREFSLGKPLDRRAFELPANARAASP